MTRSNRTARGARVTAALLAAGLAATLGLATAPALAHPVGPAGTHATGQAGEPVARVGHRSRHADERARGERSGHRRGRVEPRSDGRLGYHDHLHGAHELKARERRARHRRCGPRRALRKAWRLGLDDPRVERIRRRGVVVSGYDGRELVRIRFARDPQCTIMRVRYR